MRLQRGARFWILHDYNVGLIVDTGIALDILKRHPAGALRDTMLPWITRVVDRIEPPRPHGRRVSMFHIVRRLPRLQGQDDQKGRRLVLFMAHSAKIAIHKAHQPPGQALLYNPVGEHRQDRHRRLGRRPVRQAVLCTLGGSTAESRMGRSPNHIRQQGQGCQRPRTRPDVFCATLTTGCAWWAAFRHARNWSCVRAGPRRGLLTVPPVFAAVLDRGFARLAFETCAPGMRTGFDLRESATIHVPGHGALGSGCVPPVASGTGNGGRGGWGAAGLSAAALCRPQAAPGSAPAAAGLEGGPRAAPGVRPRC